MKNFRRIFVVCILLFALAVEESHSQKVKSREEEGSNEVSSSLSTKQNRYPSPGGGGMRGSCSCRDIETQMDILETRLDGMIELWNDFVDRNGGGRPPGPGRGGPYYDRDRDFDYRRQPGDGRRQPQPPMMTERDRAGNRGDGRFTDRGGFNDRDMGYDNNPRRFRF